MENKSGKIITIVIALILCSTLIPIALSNIQSTEFTEKSNVSVYEEQSAVNITKSNLVATQIVNVDVEYNTSIYLANLTLVNLDTNITVDSDSTANQTLTIEYTIVDNADYSINIADLINNCENYTITVNITTVFDSTTADSLTTIVSTVIPVLAIISIVLLFVMKKKE